MTSPEQFIAGLPLKATFHDAHEERSYLRAIETARRLLEDPSLLNLGARHLERFVRPDPHQAGYYALWRGVLDLGATETVRRLLEDSEPGRALRDSSPVFIRFSPDELRALWRGRADR